MPTEFPNSAHFANALAFIKPWRRYQARVLEKLPRFLKDGHFHLVAAPGSGKTVLGLEIIRQLGQPTLVLAPTLAIREQWIYRLTADFFKGRRIDRLAFTRFEKTSDRHHHHHTNRSARNFATKAAATI